MHSTHIDIRTDDALIQLWSGGSYQRADGVEVELPVELSMTIGSASVTSTSVPLTRAELSELAAAIQEVLEPADDAGDFTPACMPEVPPGPDQMVVASWLGHRGPELSPDPRPAL